MSGRIKMSENRRPFVAYLESDVFERLEKVSAKEDRTVTGQIRYIINQFLKNYETESV